MKTNAEIAAEFREMLAERVAFIRHCRQTITDCTAAGFTGLAASVRGFMIDAARDAARYRKIVAIWARPAAPDDPTPLRTALAEAEPFFCAHEGGFTHREFPAGLPGWRHERGMWDQTQREVQ